jgi:hypothetical protein
MNDKLESTVQVFVWTAGENLVRRARLLTEILTRNFPGANQDCSPLGWQVLMDYYGDVKLITDIRWTNSIKCFSHEHWQWKLRVTEIFDHKWISNSVAVCFFSVVSVFSSVVVLLSEILSGNQRIYWNFVVYETLLRITAVNWKVDKWMNAECRRGRCHKGTSWHVLMNFVKLTRNLALLIA